VAENESQLAFPPRFWWLLSAVVVVAAVFVLVGCRRGSEQTRSGEMIPVVPKRSVPFPVARTAGGASSLTQGADVALAADDGWRSERLAGSADARLKQVATWLVTRHDASEVPSGIPETFLTKLVDGIPKSVAVRASFKVVSVTASEGAFDTTVRAELAFPAEQPTHQRNSQWTCRWLTDADSTVRMVSAELETSEEAERPVDQDLPWYVDVTASALGDSTHPQHSSGIDAWSQRLTRIDEMTLQGHHGLALGDVDGDGLEDLYVCDGGGLPNRLYLQKPDGALDDVSQESKIDWLESSSAALFVDFDNDGDQDLVVATVPLILFSENDGTGSFEFRGGHDVVSSAYTLAAADYDNDGDIDLYATNYSGRAGETMGKRGFEAQAPMPFHDANNGGRNALLENRGDFQFVDVTAQVGLDTNNRRFSFSASWEDTDNDGDQDLYVANDFGRNNLYQNDGGHFQDVAAVRNAEDVGAGMSADWADCNRDGHMDLYVGNMFSAAGNRVTFQEQFSAKRTASTVSHVQRMARGNSLLLGGDTFEDVSVSAGVHVGKWAWSSKFVDFNNDGWQDLLVANGYLSNRRSHDL
jgi:hypothetical protein